VSEAGGTPVLWPPAYRTTTGWRAGVEAAEYSRLAGDHARSIYANGDALAHYEAALALGHPRAGELHEAIGDLHTLRGEYAAALTDYEAAAAFLDGEELAGLEHKLGNVHARRGDRDVAESHYEAALAAFAARRRDR
jgi:tetratricopeptide (TPR) repeat protein